MKPFLKNVFLVFLLLTVVNCKEEEVTSREYPRLKTLAVTDISSEGARFTAEIIFRGSFEILNYGFVWGTKENPTIENSERVVLEGSLQSRTFSKTINTTLIEDEEYHVRAFVKTEDYLVYGRNTKFVSLGSQAPVIQDFNPRNGTLGDTILIRGKNFSYIENKVYFEDIEAQIASATDTSLHVIVPDEVYTAINRISVSIKNNKALAEQTYNVNPPQLIKLYPEAGRTYDTIKIDGLYIGHKPKHVNVIFNNNKIGTPNVASVLSNNNNEILVTVPENLNEDSKIFLTVAGMTDSINFTYKKPEIISINKTGVSWADTLFVNTKNFYNDKSMFEVMLNESSIPVLDATDSLFSIVVPNHLSQIKNHLSVEIAGFDLKLDAEINLNPPIIRSINLDTAAINDTVIIYGASFHPEVNHVKLNDGILEPFFNSKEIIKFTMPESRDYNNFYNEDNDMINLSVISNDAFSASNKLSADTSIILRRPKIIDLNPKAINNLDETITVSGYNFGLEPVLTLSGRNYYSDGSSQAFSFQSLNIIESNNNMIKFKLTPEIFDGLRNAEFSGKMQATLQVVSFSCTSTSDDKLNYQYTTPWDLLDNPVYNLGNYYRQDPQVISDENFGYVIGGIGPPPQPQYNREMMPDFWRFDPTSNSWTRLANWKNANDYYQNLELAFIYDKEIYAIANSGRFIKYEPISNSWLKLDSLRQGKYDDYFELGGRNFVVYCSSNIGECDVWELDILNSEMDSIGSFPLKWWEHNYNYKQNDMLRIVGHDYSHYELNPNTFEWQTVNEDIVDQRIFNYNSKTYMYDKTSIYLYNPLMKMVEFPSTIPNISFAESELMFLINGKFYFKEDNTIMYSYDIE